MSQSLPPEQIDNDELMARFMTKKDWVRIDGTIKQDAFIPPKDLHLSVIRHNHLSLEELWATGQAVANEINKGQEGTPFYGRVDVTGFQVEQCSLKAVPYPLSKFPTHAHIDGWPADKDARKSLAQDLAVAAGRVVRAC